MADNAKLFGDSDDSSDDEEFDGGISGGTTGASSTISHGQQQQQQQQQSLPDGSNNTASNNNNTGGAAKPMNELFGEGSDDSDEEMDDGDGGGAGTETAGTTATQDGEKQQNAALFGSDDDSSDDENKKKKSNNESINQNESATNTTGNNQDYEEEGDDEFQDDDIIGSKQSNNPSSSTSTPKVSNVNMSVLNIQHPKKKNVSYHIMKCSKVVAIQPDAYDAESYSAPVEEEQFKGHALTNLIRWKYVPKEEYGNTKDTGNLERNEDERKSLKRHSNAKIVKWSDGTFGLVVGKEVFDLGETPCLTDTNGVNPNNKMNGKGKKGSSSSSNPLPQEYLYLTQKAMFPDSADATNKETILECVAPLKSKFAPQVASLFSRAHKASVEEKRKKTLLKAATIQQYVTYADPEKEKEQRIRNNEDLHKQREGRSGGRRSTGGNRRRSGMSRSYLEEEEEGYDSVNLNKLKRKTMNSDAYDEYESDGGYQDDAWSANKRKRAKPSRRQQESEDEFESEEEEFMAEDEEEEEQIAVRRNEKKKQNRTSVFDDDDDSE